MIRIIMTHLKHSVELQLPTDYEHVLVSLWKLGLKRDPARYTLRELKVVFKYDIWKRSGLEKRTCEAVSW